MNLDTVYSYFDGEEKQAPLKDILAPKTVLFFYPKSNTPGCTVENKDFSEMKQDFIDAGYEIIGVSKDSVESHKNFCTKQGLTHTLISDPELVLHKEVGAFGEKNNYGKIVQGVMRSTFIIHDGEIVSSFTNVRAKGHAARMLKEIQK